MTRQTGVAIGVVTAAVKVEDGRIVQEYSKDRGQVEPFCGQDYFGGGGVLALPQHGLNHSAQIR